MTNYDKLREASHELIANYSNQIAEKAEDVARSRKERLGRAHRDGEVFRELVNLRVRRDAERDVLGAYDALEQADKQAADLAARKRAATTAALQTDSMEPHELRIRSERLLSHLSRKHPKNGLQLTGSDLGRWLCGKRLDDQSLDVLRAASRTKQPIGVVQQEAQRFMTEFEKGNDQ